VARRVRLATAPRTMKERHLRLELAQMQDGNAPPGPSSTIRAVGWGLAARALELRLAAGSIIDLAYRIRENDHPQYGGLEVEIAGIRLCEEDSKRTEAHD
jgi:single-stranded-DNA-specific exonuclease